MRIVAALLLLLLMCLPALAAGQDRPFDWTPTLVYGLARQADHYSTHVFLTNGSGCVEGNWRIFGRHPSDARIALINAAGIAFVGGTHYLLYRATRGHSAKKQAVVRWINRGVGYQGAGYSTWIALTNLRDCPAKGLR